MLFCAFGWCCDACRGKRKMFFLGLSLMSSGKGRGKIDESLVNVGHHHGLHVYTLVQIIRSLRNSQKNLHRASYE